MARITNREIIEKLDRLESRLPNGEVKELKSTVDKLVAAQQAHVSVQETQFSEVNKHIRSLEKRLYNPDDGVIVKINRLVMFKGTITKALWIVFGTLATLAAATIQNLMK